MARSRREGRGERAVDIWPGFVDALSTLLLSLIFLLVVFVLGQFFLGQLLQGRTQTVLRLEGRVSELDGRLEQERDAAAELRRTLTRLNGDLRQAFIDRDEAQGRLASADGERDRLGERLATLAEEQAAARRDLESLRGEAEAGRVRAADLERTLAETRRTVTADRGTIEAQLGDLARLRREIEELAGTRQVLEGRVAALAEAAAKGEEERRRLAGELEAGKAAGAEAAALSARELEARRAELAELERARAEEESRTLTGQIATLSRQLASLDQALGLKQQEVDAQNATIAGLGQRLNVALASKVEELSAYRSEFFGRLRQALGAREDVRTVGDRFVFQSEVLFPPGGAEIDPAGQAQLAKLAAVVRGITAEIPAELPWVLQVDGHTDRLRINTPRFPSNWELSTARAIAVARYLVEQGIAPDRVAARGFAEFQPLDPGAGGEALRRNRRIEIKLTTR